jgi:hypothetical protein
MSMTGFRTVGDTYGNCAVYPGAGQVAIDGCGAGDAPFNGFSQGRSGEECELIGVWDHMESKAIGIPT